MVKMKNQSNELFFVEVKSPGDVKRNILETLKDILELMHKFESFKHIRHEKLEDINKLRALLKETHKMMGALRSKLPQTNLRVAIATEAQAHPKKASHKKKKKGKVAEQQEKIPKKEKTELEKLESELSAIESKLKSLT